MVSYNSVFYYFFFNRKEKLVMQRCFGVLKEVRFKEVTISSSMIISAELTSAGKAKSNRQYNTGNLLGNLLGNNTS